MRYRPEIDGLRAIAVVPVILFHAGFSVFSGGFVGVDIFFVISGYLITTIIYSELMDGSFSLVSFYERRARRILPALFFMLFACLPFAWLWLAPSDMRLFAQSLASISVFSSNIFFWQTSGYFGPAADMAPLLHTWSLSVEEQYYLFFPFFLIVLWRFSRRAMLGVLVFFTLASLMLADWLVKDSPSPVFYLLPTRGWELMIGAIAALLLRSHHKPAPFLIAQLGSLAGFLMVCISIFFYDKSIPTPSFYTLVPTVGALFLILFASGNTLVGRLLAHKAFVGIGLMSYSAYLWHQPILSFARHRLVDDLGFGILAVLLCLTFLMAYLSWRYVEAPFRRSTGWTRAGIFKFSGLGSLLFISLGVAGSVTHGFAQQRSSDGQIALMKTAVPSPLRDRCHTGGVNYRKVHEACEYRSGTLGWAIFGDSHTVEIAYALSAELAKAGKSLKHYSFSGCVPMFGREKKQPCTKWTKEALNYIAARHDIDTVVISYRINAALFGEHEGKYPRQVDAVANMEREKRWRSYVDAANYLAESGKKVILVLQSPELPTPIDRLIFHSADSNGLILGASRSWWDARNAFVMARLGDFSEAIRVIDTTELFCNKSYCMAARDHVAYYFDDDHLSLSGAALVAKEIVKGHITFENVE